MVVNGIKGSTEVKRNKESGFMEVGGVIHVIKSTKEGSFSGVTAAVS
jgi:hypothetical protein